jgi:PAS domain S-box-containing protein
MGSITSKKSKRNEKITSRDRLFQAIIENSLDAVRLIDQKGNIIYASPSTQRILGYTPEEYKKLNIFDLLHPDDEQIYKQTMQKVISNPNSTVSLTYRVRHKDGTWRWIEGVGRNSLDDPDIRALVSHYRDITDKKQAEEVLLASEEKFRTLIKYSSDVVELLDEKGGVLYASDSLKHILGYTFAQVQDKNFFDFVHPEDKQLVTKKWKELIEKPGKYRSAVFRVKHKNGAWIWIEAIGVNYLNRDTIGAIVANFRDISARKRAEKRVQESQYTLQTIIDASPLAVYVVDPAGKVIVWSKAAEQVFGWKKADVLGEMLPIVQKSKKREFQSYLALLLQGKSFTKEVTRQRKDGKQIQVSISAAPILNSAGEIMSIVAIASDITDRKTTEQALQQSGERLRLALQAGKIGVWDWNIINNTITWSPEVYEIHGISQDEFDGDYRDYHKFIHPDDHERMNEAVQRSIKQHTPYDLEFRIITPKGEVRWVATSAIVFYDKNKPVRMLGATSNITERKRLEAQKEEFMGIVSHELKTPVTSLKAYGQVLQRRFEKANDATSAAMLAKMDGQINKLTSLIQDLLDVTKIEGGKLQFTDSIFSLDDLVDEVIEEVQRTTDSHQIMRKGKSLGTLVGDRERTGQVIMNFLTNAVKYSPHADKILVHLNRKKTLVQLAVEDFGVGIPKEDLKHIFTRFYRVSSPAHNTVPGIGLGLYISSEIIQRQGGKIWVESVQGKGSKFCFSLPIADHRASPSI